jgi:hypothetical protein
MSVYFLTRCVQEVEWEAALRQVVHQSLDLSNSFGFPDATSPHGFQLAFEIYA